MSMWTKEFWIDLLERAIATFAQTVIALVGVNYSDAVTLDWPAILVASLIAGGLSVLKGVASSYFGVTNNPSVVQYHYDPVESEPVTSGD